MSLENHHPIAQRKQKLDQLRQLGNPYPNDFRRDTLVKDILDKYQNQDTSPLLDDEIGQKTPFRLAGRMMRRRIMGKASFFDLQDMSGRIQVYVHSHHISKEAYDAFKEWDLGDILGIIGHAFWTKTGELSIKAEQLRLITKTLQPLPDKFHGLQNAEIRYRQRELDLIVNPEVRLCFLTRSKLLKCIRNFLDDQGFLEVETPMMQPLAGGAIARPFITHHNTLNIPLYLRIAPELYLKRLVVGGFEKVYEINRNFRNEGISSRHNPEFTMLEFYEAYTDYQEGMELLETLLRLSAQSLLGCLQFEYQGELYDLAPAFQRLTVEESLLKFNPDWTLSEIRDIHRLRSFASSLGVSVAIESVGTLQFALFETTVEHQLKQPTFITDHPIEVSPLARRNNQNPQLADRFELYIGGRELANGFSELNDPEDQAERFKAQLTAKEAGDLEAMEYDQDYITALEYGLPPTSGVGLGIDRLAMLLSNAASIRDVILFPLLKPLTSKP